jgi:hypothetical protein
MTDNSDQNVIQKGYKEIDLLYGADVKNNTNIEFRYTEPRKLQEIEKFFIEYYISIRTNNDIFHDVNHELKYFDYSIITSINEILVTHREIITDETSQVQFNKICSVENLITKINSKLYENFMSYKNSVEKGPYGSYGDPGQIDFKDNYNIERDGSYNFSELLLIKKENILNELYGENDGSKFFYKENSEITTGLDNSAFRRAAFI